MSRMTRKGLDEIKRAYHMDLEDSGAYRTGGVDNSMYSKNLYMESLVAEVEVCWRKNRKLKGEMKACQETMLSLSAKMSGRKDTSELLHELRVLVGKMELAVYHILVRRAGYAVAYAVSVENAGDRVGPLRINRYYPTLRKAVLGELEQMGAELKRVAAELREEL